MMAIQVMATYLKDRKQIDVGLLVIILLNHRKAFDKAPHKHLLYKLNYDYYGMMFFWVRQPCSRWMKTRPIKQTIGITQGITDGDCHSKLAH